MRACSAWVNALLDAGAVCAHYEVRALRAAQMKMTSLQQSAGARRRRSQSRAADEWRVGRIKKKGKGIRCDEYSVSKYVYHSRGARRGSVPFTGRALEHERVQGTRGRGVRRIAPFSVFWRRFSLHKRYVHVHVQMAPRPPGSFVVDFGLWRMVKKVIPPI
eukprot:scaffold51436_cov25-Tisochrysis_lutea.AAC.1